MASISTYLFTVAQHGERCRIRYRNVTVDRPYKDVDVWDHRLVYGKIQTVIRRPATFNCATTTRYLYRN